MDKTNIKDDSINAQGRKSMIRREESVEPDSEHL